MLISLEARSSNYDPDWSLGPYRMTKILSNDRISTSSQIKHVTIFEPENLSIDELYAFVQTNGQIFTHYNRKIFGRHSIPIG